MAGQDTIRNLYEGGVARGRLSVGEAESDSPGFK